MFFLFYIYFSLKIKLDISSESSPNLAGDSHELSILIFSENKKKKKKKNGMFSATNLNGTSWVKMKFVMHYGW